MRVLLDTHSLLWWMNDSAKLSKRAKELFEASRSELLWSAVSTAEMAVKLSIGRLTLKKPLDALMTQVFREDGVTPLALTHNHCYELARLPLHHRDPFDRLLISQALAEDVPVLTADRRFRDYDVEVLW